MMMHHGDTETRRDEDSLTVSKPDSQYVSVSPCLRGVNRRWGLMAFLCCASMCSLVARAEERPQVVGVTGCVRCHRQPAAAEAELDYSQDVLHFVGLDQATTWEKHDRHRLAVSNLFEERGLRMMELLGKVPVTDESRDLNDPAHRELLKTALLGSQECLSCHADWRAGQTAPELRQLLFGVQCEACHGAASNWYLPHTKPEWRKLNPREKQHNFGMIDVRNPVARAGACLSCHVGNVAQGKILTHAMYAAGHPRLPEIEIESFLDQVPRHWRDLEEKPDFQFRNEFASANGYRPEELRHSRGVMLSALVTLQHTVDQLAERLRAEEHAPDFAVFNCTDCHHDLRRDTFRPQAQRPGVRPTRPRLAAWPVNLVDLAVRHVAQTPEEYSTRRTDFFAKLENFRMAAVLPSPNGALGDHRAYAEIQGYLVELLAAAEQRPFTKTDARASFDLLTHPTAESRLDYNAARQIAWAAKAIISELQAEPSRAATDEQVRELFTSKTTLDMLLVLPLPRGSTAAMEAHLRATQRATYSYDPERFRRELQLLRAELRLP